MPRFARLELMTDLPNAGGARVSFIPDLVALQTTRDVTGIDQIDFTLPRSSRVVPLLRAGQGFRLLRRSTAGVESEDHWRLSTLIRGSGPDNPTASYTAQSPLIDLARVDIAQTLSTGETIHSFSVTQMTAAEIIDTFLIPCLAPHGLGYWSRGTIDVTTIVPDFSWSWWSALQLLQKIRDLVIGELDAHAVSTTGYAFDIVNQIGASAPRPRFRVRKNILSNRLSLGTDQQVTRCLPRGDPLPDGSGEYQSIARMIFQVTNVAGGLVTLADPAGRMSPIGITNQFQNWYLYRQKTGGTWLITASDPVAQTVTLTVSPGTTPGTLAAGEFVELRPTEPAAIRIAARPLSPAAVGEATSIPYYSAAGGSGTRIVLSDAWDNTQTWPAFDGQYADDFAAFCAPVLSQVSGNVNGAQSRFEFTAAVTGAQVGDIAYYVATNSVTKPYTGARTALWEVTAIDAVNKWVFVKAHWPNHTAALPTLSAVGLVIVRPGTTLQILDTHASTHELEFAVTAPTFGAAGGQIVLVERRLGGGALPNYLDHPAAAVAVQSGGYGVIARPLDKPGFRGEGNLVPNPTFATWTTPTNPPDGYTVSGSAPSSSQNTDPALVKYGAGRSWNILAADLTHSTVAASPVAQVQQANYGVLSRIAIKVSFFLSVFSGDSRLSISIVSGDGLAGQTLRTWFSADNLEGETGDNVLAAGAWYEFQFSGFDFTILNSVVATDRGGYKLTLGGSGGTNGLVPFVSFTLDALAIYQIAYDPGAGNFANGSYANDLLKQGTAQLGAFAMPLPTYALTIADLERIPGSPYVADVLAKGGVIDLVDADLTVVDTPRLTRLVTNELQYTDAQLTLAEAPRWLTRLLAATSPT